jgi:hypothetical protein
MSSWYSINMRPQSGGNPIFYGCFKVDDATNVVTSFHETINGTTEFSNILAPFKYPGIDDWQADNYWNYSNCFSRQIFSVF